MHVQKGGGMRKILLVVLLAATVAAGGYGWRLYASEQAAPVVLCQVTEGKLERCLAVATRLRGREEFTAISTATGIVSQVFVQPGERVQAGQALLRLDSSIQEQALTNALAAAGQPQILAQQVTEALSLTGATLTDALQNQEQSSLSALEQALEAMTVRAPADGIIQQVLVTEHSGLLAGTAAVAMTSEAQQLLCALVPKDALLLSSGMTAYLSCGGEAVGTAVVERIAPATADAESGIVTHMVYLAPDALLELPIGTQVDAEIVLQCCEQVPLLPLSAVTSAQTVWWVADGRAWETPVTILMQDAQQCWVNLPEGTLVVDAPVGLANGQRVMEVVP